MEPRHLPTTMWSVCPIRASLGVLGKRWTLLILRDVAFFDKVRFSDILANNKGLGPRILTMRLAELRKEGLIERVDSKEDGREVHYRLTKKGHDVVPILTAFIQFGAVHRADAVFADQKPRKMKQLFPRERDYMLGQLYGYAQPGRASR